MLDTRAVRRRDFLRAATLGTGIAAVSGVMPAWAQPVSRGAAPSLATLSGNDIALTIGEVALQVDGKTSP